MGTKKRKASQSVTNDDSEASNSGPVPNKRRRKPVVQYDPAEICQELYETLRNHKSDDGRLVCESFIRAPKRRTEPEYYEKISTPIDFLKIQHKLKSDEYDDIDQFTADIRLLLDNAKTFYKKTSQENQDACELWELYQETKQVLLSEVFGDTPEPANQVGTDEGTKEVEESDDNQSTTGGGDDVELMLGEMFSTVVLAKDGDRSISELFKLLPPKNKLPTYYQVIKEPRDLKAIAIRIQEGSYKALEELVKDLHLMVNNAKTFNEPGSVIHNDAKALAKIIQAKKMELDRIRPQRNNKSERTRSRRLTQLQRASAECASLEYPSDEDTEAESNVDSQSQIDYEEESGAEGSVIDGEDSTQWMLYNTVKDYKIPTGQVLSEPFMKMPNRRLYPDYYEEIKKPMSLMLIKKKIRENQYDGLHGLAGDLDLVFENAMQYNMDESRLYQDAAVLKRVTQKKKTELETGQKDEIDCVSDIVVTQTPQPPSRNRRAGLDTPEEEKKKPRKNTPEDVLKRRLHLLYKTVFDYKVDGRSLIDIFVTLPSKKEYPNYYQVISEPIDMTMIDNKIKNDKYTHEHALVADLQLMFNNARHYNEEGSLVYKDAETLEKVLKVKLRNLTPLDNSTPRPASKGKPTRSKSMSPISQKLQDLYNCIKDFSDAHGRTLSTPFIRLPLKNEYPDYYEIIKRPMDMTKISQRMASHQYNSLEDMVSDFVLMFDNACKYNEPDSIIYKDALTLQRICLERKAELCQDDNSNEVPDVKAAVQALMTKLFITTYNHADEDGRCFSDSFLDMPSVQDEEGAEDEKPPADFRKPCFDQVKKNLDKGRYKRIDRFQQDMFEVFEYARRVSRTDSQLYEDSVELQLYFIKMRDELCRNGEHVLTPALSYTDRHLTAAVEMERKEKLPREQKEDEEKKKLQGETDKLKEETGNSEDSLDFQEQTYHIGDFVYIEPRSQLKKLEKGLEPHIVCIDKLWKDDAGEQWLHGCWFLRPNETYHLATRKFLEKEVFKSDFYDSSPFSQVQGKCYVMFVKEYFRMKPEGFSEKDVYVCESRYSAKHKAFKKIKIWQIPRNEHVNITPRDTFIVPVRVASVFAEKIEDKMDFDDGETDILDKVREVVEAEQVNEDDPNIYFEQYQLDQGWFKLGDFVYVKAADDKIRIARIDKLWTDRGKKSNSRGEVFFQGPYFIQPSEVNHAPTRLFYHREVFHSQNEETYSARQIQSLCYVLLYKDYCNSRPTEIPEQHIYICESKYLENEKSIRKLAKGMKKHSLSPKVCDDEIYFFKKPIIPKKIDIVTGKPVVEPSPLLPKAGDMVYHEDDTVSSQETSFNESFAMPEQQAPVEEAPTPEPVKEKKKVEKKRKGHISAYLVFAAESRKRLSEERPDCTFGEISKIVGAMPPTRKIHRVKMWRELPKCEKVKYEERAKKIAEEQAVKQAEADKALQESLNRFPPQQSGQGAQGQYPVQGQGYPQQGNYPQQGYPPGSYPPGQAGPSGMPGTPMGQGYQPGMPMPQTPQGMMTPHGYPGTPMSHHMGPPMPPGTPLHGHPGTPQTPITVGAQQPPIMHTGRPHQRTNWEELGRGVFTRSCTAPFMFSRATHVHRGTLPWQSHSQQMHILQGILSGQIPDRANLMPRSILHRQSQSRAMQMPRGTGPPTWQSHSRGPRPLPKQSHSRVVPMPRGTPPLPAMPMGFFKDESHNNTTHLTGGTIPQQSSVKIACASVTGSSQTITPSSYCFPALQQSIDNFASNTPYKSYVNCGLPLESTVTQPRSETKTAQHRAGTVPYDHSTLMSLSYQPHTGIGTARPVPFSKDRSAPHSTVSASQIQLGMAETSQPEVLSSQQSSTGFSCCDSLPQVKSHNVNDHSAHGQTNHNSITCDTSLANSSPENVTCDPSLADSSHQHVACDLSPANSSHQHVTCDLALAKLPPGGDTVSICYSHTRPAQSSVKSISAACSTTGQQSLASYFNSPSALPDVNNAVSASQSAWMSVAPQRPVDTNIRAVPISCSPMAGQQMQGQQVAQSMPPPPPPRPPSPMFVSVPPRTQRLLHSEAYLRYIEGLTPEKQTIGDWDKTMKATIDNTQPSPNGRLPTHWLQQGAGVHGSTLNALWALRDLMLKDALTISRTLEFNQL